MTQTYQSWLKTYLSVKLEPWDTTVYLNTAPTVTKGRLFLNNGSQKEWIKFTGVSWSTCTGCTRLLSQTAVPATWGTGLTWIAGTEVKLVAMHDQLADVNENTTFLWSLDVDWALDVDGAVTLDGSLRVPVYATTAARDVAIPAPSNGMIVYITADWVLYQYIGWAWTTFATGSVVNGSEVVAGKFQQSTQVAFDAWTDLWSTGAQNVPKNSQILAYVVAQIAIKNWANYQISQNNFNL